MHNKKATRARFDMNIVTRRTCVISFSQAFTLYYFTQPDMCMASIWELLHSVQVLLLACYGRAALGARRQTCKTAKRGDPGALNPATVSANKQVIENQHEIRARPFQNA
jgi:hypothetical protein